MADKKNIEYGIVYLLTNPVMPGLVKIGMTTQKEIDNRMKELYTTGVPVPFECQFACRVKKNDCAKIEKALHTAFAPERVNVNREFFRIKVEQAKAILELFHHEDFTEAFKDEIEDDLTPDDKEAVKKAKPRRPPLNFHEMGLHDGDTLVFVEDPSITAEIIGPKRVRSGDDKDISLTALTTKLRNTKYACQPTPWWTFDGKNLNDIYDETYPIEEE